LAGLHFRRDTQLVMGWLGPRGLASVVFTIIAYENFLEAGRSFDTLFAMAGWTIVLSVLLHGFSARPLARWYAHRLKSAPPNSPELVDMADLDELQNRSGNLQHAMDIANSNSNRGSST
jgi:NhaP-type Na+/H+ or K+/H+ antiporter